MLQDQALSTFNFLNNERRYVAGAFIPPHNVDVAEDEVYSLTGDVDMTATKSLGMTDEDFIEEQLERVQQQEKSEKKDGS